MTGPVQLQVSFWHGLQHAHFSRAVLNGLVFMCFHVHNLLNVSQPVPKIEISLFLQDFSALCLGAA